MTSDIQGRLLAVALNSLRSRGKLLSGLRMFLRNAHLGAIIIGHRAHLWSLALSLSLGRGAEGGEGRERGSLPSSRSGCSRAVWTDERDGLGVVGGRQSIGLALPRRGAQFCPPSEPLRK